MKDNKCRKGMIFRWALILFLMFAFVGQVTAESILEFEERSNNDYINPAKTSLNFELTSYNLDNSDRVLQSTNISLKDSDGKVVKESFERDVTVEPAAEDENSPEEETWYVGGESFSDSLDGLDALKDSGDWYLYAEDIWEDGETTSVNYTLKTEASGSVQLTPKNTAQLDDSKDLVINVTRVNDYNVKNGLTQTEIGITDSDGKTVNVVKDQSSKKDFGAGEDRDYRMVVSYNKFNSLQPGTWTIDIEDTWDHGSASAQTSIDGESSEITISIESPSDGDSVQFTEQSSKISVDSSLELVQGSSETFSVQSYVEGLGGSKAYSTDEIQLDSGSSKSLSQKVDLSNLETGEDMVLNVTATGESSGSTDSKEITFDANETTSEASVTITNPSSGSNISGDKLDVKWDSSVSVGTKYLEESVLRFFNEGNTVNRDYNVDRAIDVSGTVSDQLTIDLKDVGSGNYTLRIEDVYQQDTAQAETVVNVERQEDSDGSTSIDSLSYDRSNGEIIVQRTSSVQNGQPKLQETSFKVYGDVGMLYSESVSINKDISDQTQNTYAITADLNSGEYEVVAEDVWSFGTTQSTSMLQVDSESEDGQDDGSEDGQDDGSEDGQDDGSEDTITEVNDSEDSEDADEQQDDNTQSKNEDAEKQSLSEDILKYNYILIPGIVVLLLIIAFRRSDYVLEL